PAALFTLFNGIARLEIADQLGRITIPCYLFSGTHDPVVPPAQSLVLVSKISHARSVVFQGVGHMPFMEATDAYFEELTLALQDITEQTDSAKRNKGQGK